VPTVRLGFALPARVVMRKLLPVIFDVEGTLIDSVEPTIKAWQTVLADAGHEFSYQQLHRYSGMDPKRMLRRLVPDIAAVKIKSLIKAQGELYRAQYLDGVRPFPGAQALFAELASHHRLALGTSCDPNELKVYLERLQIACYLDAIACGDDVKEGKPAPDLFNLAKKRMKVDDGELAFVVGDTPYDAEAARAANAVPFGTEGGGFSRQALLNAGCEDVAKNLTELSALLRACAAHGQPV
jgi:HAD superfamily hydrolase (TIGR01549 family)